MGKLVIGNQEYELSTEEYRRFVNRTRKNHEFQVLRSGVVVKSDQIRAIVPDKGDIVTPSGPEKKTVAVTPETARTDKDPTDQGYRVTAERVAETFEASELSKAAFAATIGYSPASLQIALKEGRISQEFSDAFVKKYGEGKEEDFN